jgi:hypothetical protein
MKIGIPIKVEVRGSLTTGPVPQPEPPSAPVAEDDDEDTETLPPPTDEE